MKNISIILLIFLIFISNSCGPAKNNQNSNGTNINFQPLADFPEIKAALQTARMSVYNQGTVPIKDFQLQNLEGQRTSLSEQKGKVVLLNFWATWCGPCRNEMPSMEKLYQKYKSQGFEILAVNLQEPVETVKAFIKDQGYSFPVLLDSDGTQGQAYGARGIPTSYLIDQQGYMIAGIVGETDWSSAQIAKALELLFKQRH